MTTDDAIKALQAMAAKMQTQNGTPLATAAQNGVAAGLNYAARSAAPPPAPAPLDMAPPEMAPRLGTLVKVDRIDRNLTERRIYIYFSEKPDFEVRESLKDQHFSWNPTKRAWHCYDSAENREFLTNEFNAEFDNIMPATAHQAALAPEPLPEPAPEVITLPDEPTDALLNYKQQVDSLIVALNMDGADLLIYAIDCLYKQHRAQAN